MKFDLHTHHSRCGHAIGTIEDYINAAINNDLQIIGISDHSPFFGSQEDHLKPCIAMAKSEFPHYVSEVIRLKEAYKGKIEILLGIESDFFPEYKDIYINTFNKYPFDYIIGSVHYTNGVNIFNKDRWEGLTEFECLQEKELYYCLIQQSAQSRMFDILGHIDAMKADFPRFSEIKTDIIDETLRIIAECNMVIEVNTSGKMEDCGEWYPSNEILERAHFYGVQVTFGSDAHSPDRIADEWEKVKSFLKAIGYKRWVIFRNRKMEFLPL